MTPHHPSPIPGVVDYARKPTPAEELSAAIHTLERLLPDFPNFRGNLCAALEQLRMVPR